MAFQTSTNNYEYSKYIVDPVAGQTPYLTIQSAINAAVAALIPATIVIRAGTFTENLTLYDGIQLQGSNAVQSIIIGTHTPPNSGRCAFVGINFTSTTDALNSAAAGTATLTFSQCAFTLTDGYACNVTNWTGAILFEFCSDFSTVNGLVLNTSTANITMNNNTIGAGLTKSLKAGGVLTLFNTKLSCPIELSGAAVSFIDGGSTLNASVTVLGAADLSVSNSRISTGSAVAIHTHSSTAIKLSNVNITTTNAYAITGNVGTEIVNFSSVTFTASNKLNLIVQGLVGTVKTGEIFADTILRMKFTGFYAWAGGSAAPYFDDTTLGSFTVTNSGTGYIKGVLVSWTGPQTVTGMAAGNCYFIYMDSTGTIGKAIVDNATRDSVCENYIVLFQCLRNSTAPTNTQITVREDHPYSFPTSPSNYLHDVIGPVINNFNNGANITLSGTQKIGIAGDDELEDHGLVTTISAIAAVTAWNKYYTNAAGKWCLQNSNDTFTGYWNNAGTATALTAGRFGVYTLYVSKDNMNTSTPTYYAVLNTAQYTTSGAASTAIANGTTARASAELYYLELAQLGYIIYRESTAAITTVTISKSTLKATLSTGGTNTAALVTTTVANFDGILSASDTNVQTALETIDTFGKDLTDKSLVVGNGNGVALGVIAVGGTGTILTGVSANDPTWTTATYPSTIAMGDVVVGTAANVVGVVATAGATATYLLTANGAGAVPTWQAATAAGFTWAIRTTDLDPMVVNNGYIANKAGLLLFTLPATCAVGKTMRITGMNTALGWKVVQLANQIIHFGTSTTTTGTAGYVSSTEIHDSIELVCCVADLEFIIVSCTGNPTIN